MSSAVDRSLASAFDNSQDRLQRLLRSLGLHPLKEDQAQLLSRYLGLLLRWNAKMNLTAIRDEEGILRRNFVESIACARSLPSGVSTLLDYGSGGGFPGVPCAICRTEIQVTLAESQGKKAAFLREVVRNLGLNAEVHEGRVEGLKAGLLFDVVTLRAVDRMPEACAEALLRVKAGGWLVILATHESLDATIVALSGVAWNNPEPLIGSDQEVLMLGRRLPS